MINRALIRLKIVQLAYAYYQNSNKTIDAAVKELLFSLSKAHDLYLHLLALIVSVTREERLRVQIATNMATRENRPKPSSVFADNLFAAQLEANVTLNDYLSTLKYGWDEDVAMVRNICNVIEQSAAYQEYMATSDGHDYEGDREVWRKIYRTIIQDNADLEALLEEKSLYWNDDKDIVDTFVLKTIKRFDPQLGEHQELLPKYTDPSDEQFAAKLFEETLRNAETYHSYMRETSRNWDFSRLAYMDIIIMQIAIAEMINFPNIPISVTINEYVGLAKQYSTPKSGAYINGMLDAIARGLIAKGTILKQINDAKPNKEIDKK